MEKKNNYKEILFEELYKKGYGFEFCGTIANVICEINPPSGDENEQWCQDIIESRLKEIKKAIQATLLTAVYQKM